LYKTRHYLLLGLLASIIVGVGEYLLHYVNEGPGGEVAMLDLVPLSRARIGHFFVIIGAPLYFIGYYGIRKVFEQESPSLAKAIYLLGTIAFFVGGIWISSRYFAAVVLQRSAGTLDYNYYLKSYLDNYQILVWALRVLIALISIIFIVLVFRNTKGMSRWVAMFNPLLLLSIVISSLLWLPALGNHIAPIAMNVVHFILFSVLLLQLKK